MDPRTLLSLLFHLPNFIRLFSRLLADPRVPYYLKMLVYGAFFYVLIPIDLFSELTRWGIGYVDDVVLLFLALRKLVRDSPPEVVREHVEAIAGRPRKEKAKTEPEYDFDVTPQEEEKKSKVFE